MQINITNGTLTQIQETLTASSGYTLPTTISVSGATSNYNSTTGAITLTNLTQTMSITASGESQATGISNIFFGNSQMASAYYGNSEISSIWYGNTKIYEKGSPTPSGYSVSVYNGYFGSAFSIYDGQNDTGTLLEVVSYNETKTFTITSGYIYAKSTALIGEDYTFYKLGLDVGNPATINENASLEINVSGPTPPDPE